MSDSNKPPFSKWLPTGEGTKRVRWYYLGALLAIGIFLMFMSTDQGENEPSNIATPQTMPESEQSENADSNALSITEIEQGYEIQLSESLETIEGISDVDIVVNVQASESKVYEKDRNIRQQTTEEEDTEGGNRTLSEGSEEETLVLVRRGDAEEPLLIRTEKPEVSGVLVVADGVERLQRKEWVIEAVTRTLDVPAHRVSVLPKKAGEDE